MALDNEETQGMLMLLDIRDDLMLISYALRGVHLNLEDELRTNVSALSLEAILRASKHISTLAEKLTDIEINCVQPQRARPFFEKTETPKKPELEGKKGIERVCCQIQSSLEESNRE